MFSGGSLPEPGAGLPQGKRTPGPHSEAAECPLCVPFRTTPSRIPRQGGALKVSVCAARIRTPAHETVPESAFRRSGIHTPAYMAVLKTKRTCSSARRVHSQRFRCKRMQKQSAGTGLVKTLWNQGRPYLPNVLQIWRSPWYSLPERSGFRQNSTLFSPGPSSQNT